MQERTVGASAGAGIGGDLPRAPEASRGDRKKLDFTPVIRTSTGADWDKYSADFLRIEAEAFADTPAGGFSSSHLRSGILGERGPAVIMVDPRTDTAIGYTWTIPCWRVRGAHYVDNTAIDTKFQGLGLVEPLMKALEDELRKRGVTVLTRDSRNYNPGPDGRTYADKVAAANKERLISDRPHESQWGPQRFIVHRI